MNDNLSRFAARSDYRNYPSKLVAIVMPMSNRAVLTPEEEISLRHLTHFLGKYDKYLVMPNGLKFSYPGFSIKHFDNKYFGSVEAHKRLLFSPHFYGTFSEYRYILIYHLDALVFSDQLTEWCERGFDYIGAPWVKHESAPYAGKPWHEGKVGNGGFSLRKIESFLNVIYSSKYQIEPEQYWKTNYGSKPKHVQYANCHKKYLKRLRYFNSARREMSHYALSEESFWSNRAGHYYPDFKIADVETALQFSFECVPRYCFELNRRTLPFGCHAWQKYDRQFWEPFLLSECVKNNVSAKERDSS
jgi:hypothetical protein